MLRDIQKGDDPQIMAFGQVMAHAAPDIVVLQSVDFDADLTTLNALNASLEPAMARYPYVFARRPNTGRVSGFDMNGNGRLGEAQDAHGYGTFAGQGGMAILSRWPIEEDLITDFTALLWQDLPDARRPLYEDGTPFPSPDAAAAIRLSTTAHWAVPVRTKDGGLLTVLTMHASPPVFDGPEDRNGLRNANELELWMRFLDGGLADRPPTERFVIAGDANADPVDGESVKEAINALLNHPLLQDPQPSSPGATSASERQQGINRDHAGDPSHDTADWRDLPGPGNLRVDYILPSRDLGVVASGVLWPGPDADSALLQSVVTASRHRLVWVDINLH
ncbi:MAG: endonuclease/exonuclease/phosphatase family protein [Pseudomonadota bacterium]